MKVTVMTARANHLPRALRRTKTMNKKNKKKKEKKGVSQHHLRLVVVTDTIMHEHSCRRPIEQAGGANKHLLVLPHPQEGSFSSHIFTESTSQPHICNADGVDTFRNVSLNTQTLPAWVCLVITGSSSVARTPR